jgi:HD superfamily phosphohydrolase YqeK
VPDPVLRRAAAGDLPDWAVVMPARRAHVARVARLMGEWSDALGHAEPERVRWLAAAWLHDALRDAEPAALTPLVPEALRDLPGRVLHGPAAAARLAADGVTDAALLRAVAWHTLGHADLDALGRTLYLADYLEPGRSFAVAERAAQRARMPAAADVVLREVLRARIGHLLAQGSRVRSETIDFWNAVATGRADARAA